MFAQLEDKLIVNTEKITKIERFGTKIRISFENTTFVDLDCDNTPDAVEYLDLMGKRLNGIKEEN